MPDSNRTSRRRHSAALKQQVLAACDTSGASVAQVLANIYLHYVFDLWAYRWRGKQAKGDVMIVRYADDSVLGFESKNEVDRFLEELKMRFAKFGLTLNEDKTRVL